MLLIALMKSGEAEKARELLDRRLHRRPSLRDRAGGRRWASLPVNANDAKAQPARGAVAGGGHRGRGRDAGRAASPALTLLPRTLSRSGEIDADLAGAVDAAEVPGVVAMVASERSVIYQGAFGVRGSDAAAKMSEDTVFRIASMVKLLTSVAAMQLVERGKLGLDEPAANIDPTLGSPQVLTGFDAKGVPQLRPARRPITLRDLLTHTSGFSYRLWDANVVRYLDVARNKPALPRTPLMFDPQRQVGLWRQSRPGRPADRNRQRQDARSLFPRPHR